MAATVVTSAPHSSAEIKSLLAGQIDADRILIRPIDLIAFASDASFYRLIPKGPAPSAAFFPTTPAECAVESTRTLTTR